jgi:hypothetical protein
MGEEISCKIRTTFFIRIISLSKMGREIAALSNAKLNRKRKI